jgi:DNA-binding CsgD family transcriptional regulator
MREARVTLDDREFATMGIADLVALFRGAGIRDVDAVACRGTGAVVEVAVAEPVPEDRLSALDCVDHWERVGGARDAVRYVVSFTAPALPDSLAGETDDLLGTCDPEVGDDAAVLSLVGAQETIAAAIREYESAGVSPDLERLGAYEGGAGPLDDLTDRQREVLRTAYEQGYFEVPRAATTDDVAAALDLDSSTVTEHLQRAERNLLAHHL